MVRVLAALMVALAVAGPAAGQSTCAHRLFVSNYFSTVRVFDACTGEYLRDLDAPTRIRGAQAVKLEGGVTVAETVRRIVAPAHQ